jgi:hypothetical protein
MNKLREKIANVYINIDKHPTLINCTLEDAGDIDTITSLEQITDDFTIKFLEWLNENSIYSPKDKEYFFNNEWHSQEETFKHFKNNIYENTDARVD